MDLHLADKRALITGSTSGIGAEIARMMALEGVSVVVHGRDRTRAQTLVADIEARGVLMRPGMIPLEVTPVPASALDRLSVRLFSAAFAAPYGPACAYGEMALREEIWITRPHPRSRIAGTNACASRTAGSVFCL